jgi:oligoribonuclease (3'-5' exoribonuclease)
MMRYCAMDIETTGLDPERCQVLEVACVVETDWTTPVEMLPAFRALIDPGELICGEPFALQMNARLLGELYDARKSGRTADLGGNIIDLSGFLERHFGKSPVTIAGKNFGAFDYRFLSRCPQWKLIRHKHRFIDVGSMWWNPEHDECLPALGECLVRAGLADVLPEHVATQDCETVIELVRAYRRVVGRGA